MCFSSTEYELDLPAGQTVGRSCEAEPEGNDELLEFLKLKDQHDVQT